MEGCLAEIDLYIDTNEVEFMSETGLIVALTATNSPDTVRMLVSL